MSQHTEQQYKEMEERAYSAERRVRELEGNEILGEGGIAKVREEVNKAMEFLPSSESSLQLREALSAVGVAKRVLLACDSIEELSRRAKNYVNAKERAAAAIAVVVTEAGVYQIASTPRDGAVLTSG